jgi:UDP-N-acetylenolpyruvoylglucosamine reductase
VPVVREQVNLSDYTTLRLGGPAKRFVQAPTEAEIVATVRDADLAGEPVLVLGGGSNLVVADAGFAGTAIRLASTGIRVTSADDGVRVAVAAGENWDQLVQWAVAEKLAGLECLAGIPGLAGATPIQNVGAYGQEVAPVIEVVRAYDRVGQAIVTLTGAQCCFGYRTSLFKRTGIGAGAVPGAGAGSAAPTGRYVVLDVTFRLQHSPMSAPVRYAELAAALGVAPGEHASLADVREAVLGLRRGKGMVLDPADPDTASAGSFFTNPVLDSDQFARLERAAAAASGYGGSVPHFPADHGQVKVPAGWLIERAGFARGYPSDGAARISSKHTLALTNPGGASTSDLIGLARQIVAGVRSAFGIELTNEPVLVGVTL